MSKAQLYQKLARAMDNFDPVLKEANNPFFKSKYANLNSLLDATVPALRAEGLLLLQPVEGSKVITMIVDTETGESIVSWVEIPGSIVDPQKILAAITYLRRGGFKSLLSIQDLDDDGNYVSGKTDKLETETKIKVTASNSIDPKFGKPISAVPNAVAPVAGTTGFKRPLGKPAEPVKPVTNGAAKPAAWDGDL